MTPISRRWVRCGLVGSSECTSTPAAATLLAHGRGIDSRLAQLQIECGGAGPGPCSALRSESPMSFLTSTWMPDVAPVTRASSLPSAQLLLALGPGGHGRGGHVQSHRLRDGLQRLPRWSLAAGRNPTCCAGVDPWTALEMTTVAMMPTSRMTVVMRKTLDRPRVTISRVATRATAWRASRSTFGVAGRRHAALGSVLVDDVAEQLGERRELAGELAYRTRRQRCPEHGLIVDAISEPERGAAAAAAEHAHPGEPVGPPCRGVWGVDDQATRGCRRVAR